ncbi:MAG: bifunctional phosphopantothenoylcysteine decarboxylase/phosphopantothenate--cysteine ligase CoaBC [Dehalococcoidia bacterium]|nr:bifunctional phosphopantothenoylcysteine decarboxylase/phosphopantothenate--cysteine ligase CoaBC [Dehalococcoidia bacterium]MQG08872.1 bifunctional phosphopantothenoylcysteine decarboxylase/phosphopantothenate--cysteine ligase CoaBC [SAR202 cluster bacterium]|tara:strand:- start:9447 stop:10682 length:1236 start_codon:yes stop_codon:yes gene_type:complete
MTDIDDKYTSKPFTLKNKNIVLCVCGSISAYKSADLASKLIQEGANVNVILSNSAQKFVGKATFEAITHNKAILGLWDNNTNMNIDHVALAHEADIIIIYPATANTIGKLAMGVCDTPITNTVLATTAPVIMAPAMDGDMFDSFQTQNNIKILREKKFEIIGPENGRLASGLIGKGRLSESKTILGITRKILGKNGDFQGEKIVITAGGTRQPIDPVRYITNKSSGKMGHFIAEAAIDRGAEVVLITTSNLITPAGAEIIKVDTAESMEKAIISATRDANILIMAAAISDFTPEKISNSKIKKNHDTQINLILKSVNDFSNKIENNITKIFFAAESENLEENAKIKLKSKNADFIVANNIVEKNSGFSYDTNKVTIIDKNGDKTKLPLMHKLRLANKILDKIKITKKDGEK